MVRSLIYVLIIVFKCCYFEWQTVVYANMPSYLLAKFAAALLIGILSLQRRQWPAITILLLIDGWCIANSLYFHANGLFLTYDSLLMADNMTGFWGSVMAYWTWDLLLYPLLSVMYIGVTHFTHLAERRKLILPAILLLGIVCSAGGTLRTWNKERLSAYQNNSIRLGLFFPFYTPVELMPEKWDMDRIHFNYVRRHSVIAYFPYSILDGYSRAEERKMQKQIQLTDEEKLLLNPLIKTDKMGELSLPEKLVIILVESWESWPFTMTDENGDSIAPCVRRYACQHPCLYADCIHSQVRHGVSGDGQLLINTGMLPLYEGAACILYATNTYPNIAKHFEQSIVINPCPNAWNQRLVTPAYGYKRLQEPDLSKRESFWSDEEVINILREQCSLHDSSTCIMALTYSTHSPFDRVEHKLKLPEDMPYLMRNYLQSIHYTDSCLYSFLQWADSAQCMQNATIVLTGDHTFFRYDAMQRVLPYAKANNLPFAEAETAYCPLLIRSPRIHDSLTLQDVYYQMDIYPTILNLIGMEGSFWHGFGINLMDTSEQQRSISPDKALQLSDKMLQMDYFRK